MRRAPIPLDPSDEVIARFVAKVAWPDHADDCWLWTASRYESGHGQAYVAHRTQRCADRVAWAWRHRRQPRGRLLHQCRNLLCVNPDHLVESVPEDVPDGVDCCDRGHPWVEENIAWRADQYGRPRRTSRACDRERSRVSTAKKVRREGVTSESDASDSPLLMFMTSWLAS